jgi:hypothetical protein
MTIKAIVNTTEDALTHLREAGYGVIEDGGAVLVVTKIGQPGHPTTLYGTEPSAVTRFDSAEIAVKALLGVSQ